MIVAWTLDQDHFAFIDNRISKVTNVKINDGNGEVIFPILEKRKLILKFKALPQYVTLPKGISLK
jgi:hypothetical protein